MPLQKHPNMPIKCLEA